MPSQLQAVVWVPEVTLETRLARAALPAHVPMHDAVFNLSRSALLVHAMHTGQLHLLATATQDALHQVRGGGVGGGRFELTLLALTILSYYTHSRTEPKSSSPLPPKSFKLPCKQAPKVCVWLAFA